MLEALSERLGAIFDRLSNRGRLSETDVAEVLREVRIALLEADVNLAVAKDFVNAIKERAVGADVLQSLTPGQSVIKIVHDQLVDLLGGAEARLQFADTPPTVYMLVGLQGSGRRPTRANSRCASKNRDAARCSLQPTCTVPPRSISSRRSASRSICRCTIRAPATR